MRSILVVSLVDSHDGVLELFGGMEGESPLESSPYQLRVFLPLTVGAALGLSETDSISLTKRAKALNRDIGQGERLTRVILSLPQALPETLLSSPAEQESLCSALEKTAGVSLFPTKALFGEERLFSEELWVGELGFQRAYAALERLNLQRSSLPGQSKIGSPRL